MTPQEESYHEFLDRVIGPLPSGEGESDAPSQGRATYGLDDDAAADRVLRQLRHITADETADERYYLAERTRLVDWFNERQTQRQQKREWLKSLLRRYYEHLKDTGKVYKPKNRQSHTPYKLPHGTLEAYVVHADYEVINGQEEAFLTWCTERGLTKIEVKPRWGDAKRTFSMEPAGVYATDPATGELMPVPGVVVTREAHEGFRVKLAGEPATEEEAGE
jgi:hypothetical protein